MILTKGLHVKWIALMMLFMSNFNKVHPLDDLIAEESSNRRIIHNLGDDIKLSRIKKVRETSDKPTPPPNNDDDDDKKTLAQQVADGKYGLIQTELFSKPVKRPGIISYEINPEVPKDNVNNFGGLQPEEIWLAENHLLVLKGGGYSDKSQDGKSVWPPIDNYIAPQRQVKIPPNPKVPPPFPVQLRDGGPIEFIKGENGSGGPPPFFDPSFSPPYLPPAKPNFGNGTHLSHPGNFTTGNGIPPPFPFLPPGLGLYPPAIAFLPPPGNFTELDEDDPSNYYPPPYDFIYPKDNSSHIPPGPLVPGIILPPPPNFFAPLQNKTRPSKPKDLYSRGRKVEKSRTSTTTPKTTLKPKYITTFKPSTTLAPEITTSKTIHSTPQLAVTTDSDHNKLNPIPTLPSNTPIGGWVPIPAPRPFYISDIENLRKKPGSTYDPGSYDKPQNGWEYTNSSNNGDYYKIKQGNWPESYPSTSPRGKKGRYFTTTPAPYDGFKPIFIHTQPIVTTSAPNPNYSYLPDYTSERLPKETYYFYEEPHITEGKIIDTDTQPYNPPRKPPKQYYSFKQQRPNYETNTLVPSQPYDEVTIRTPTNVDSIGPLPKYKYYESSYLKPSNAPQSSFEYYYFNQNGQNDGYQYNPQLGHTEAQLAPEQPFPPKPYNIQRHNNKKLNNNHYLPTSQSTKPPVYEYSYSAPGYGTLEAPKVGANFATTSKPLSYRNNYSAKDPQYSYFEYQPTPKQSTTFRYRHRHAQPQFYTTARPQYENPEAFSNLGLYPTEAPYNGYFTQQDVSLLDDITKKYFTLFGQKLNKDSLNEPVTTPLPSRPPNQRQPSYFDSDVRTTTEKAKQKIKFPDDAYNVQSERPFYSQAGKPQGYGSSYRFPTRTQKPLTKSPPYYSESSPQYQGYDEYHSLVHPHHPLDSDINVNYKQPHPPINPHAELIDPQYPSPHVRDNSYISYQLPGSGGHFYFLTPQTVNAENFHLANSGVRYPEVNKEGYYKRNANEESTQERNIRVQQKK